MQDKGGREIVERMQVEKSSPAAKRLLDTYLLQWFSDHGRRYVDKQGAAATHATSKSNHGVVAFRLRSLFIAEIVRRLRQTVEQQVIRPSLQIIAICRVGEGKKFIQHKYVFSHCIRFSCYVSICISARPGQQGIEQISQCFVYSPLE
jgi:hypothetical protein